MVTISHAAYFASLRAVAPSISAASSPAARAALWRLSPDTENDDFAAPMLRVLARIARETGAALSPEDKPLAELGSFCDDPKPSTQRKLTHAVVEKVHANVIAAARPDETRQAFLNSCDGRWVRTVRMMWLQLSN